MHGHVNSVYIDVAATRKLPNIGNLTATMMARNLRVSVLRLGGTLSSGRASRQR